MANLTYDPSDSSVSKVLYNVHEDGAAMVQCVVGSSDSPNYSQTAAEANAELLKLNPKAQSNTVT
tara:strand:+ start:43 stop:237 length:195 start_codon:yes stop_codon:yes gene_type:complete